MTTARALAARRALAFSICIAGAMQAPVLGSPVEQDRDRILCRKKNNPKWGVKGACPLGAASPLGGGGHPHRFYCGHGMFSHENR